MVGGHGPHAKQDLYPRVDYPWRRRDRARNGRSRYSAGANVGVFARDCAQISGALARDRARRAGLIYLARRGDPAPVHGSVREFNGTSVCSRECPKGAEGMQTAC